MQLAQLVQRVVGAFERKRGRCRAYGYCGRDLEEFFTVLTGEVGHGSHDPFFPQDVVGKAWDVAHVNAGADDRATPRSGFEGGGDERPIGREYHRGIQRRGWQLIRTTRPDRAKPACKVLTFAIARPRKRINRLMLMARNLDCDMRSGPKAIEADPLGTARHAQGPVSDQTGTKQRCGFNVGECCGNGEAISLVGDGIFRIASVDLIPGKTGPFAQVFPPAFAIGTCPTRPAEPRNADAVAHFEVRDVRPDLAHGSNDLMP